MISLFRVLFSLLASVDLFCLPYIVVVCFMMMCVFGVLCCCVLFV